MMMTLQRGFVAATFVSMKHFWYSSKHNRKTSLFLLVLNVWLKFHVLIHIQLQKRDAETHNVLCTVR